MRHLRAVLFVLVLALGAGACTVSVNGDRIVGATEQEVRAVERHEASNTAVVLMVLLLVVPIAPLALATVIVLVSDRSRRDR